MMLKNEIFATILDWLIKNDYVDDQKDLAKKTGITPTTISRIMTGKVEPKDDTLRKLNDAFGNIFNMQYLRGRSTTMLAKDAIYYEQHPEQNPLHKFEEILQREESHRVAEDEKTPYSTTPSWASTLIEIMSKQIKENEALHQELRQSIQEVNSLKTNLQEIISNLRK